MKKKWIVPLVLAALVGGVSSCEQSGSGKSNIKGKVFPADSLDGETVYLLKEGGKDGFEPIDSTKVVNNEFAFAPRPADTLSMFLVQLAGAGEIMFVPEAGDIFLDFVDNENSIKGGSINKSIKEFSLLVSDISERMEKEFEPLTDEEVELKRDSLLDVYQRSMREASEAALRANSANAFGQQLLKGLLSDPNLTSKRIEELKGMASPRLFENEQIQKRLKSFENKEKTSVGNPFVDIKGETSQGVAVSLSDYAGKGHYTLVDFWASWCGPCRRSMPELKEIYKEFHPKGLEIVGLVVWDELDAHKEAMAELELPWPQILNKEEATEIYGVQGIPHLILIDPSGKIIARDLHGKEEISKLLREEMSKNGGKL